MSRLGLHAGWLAGAAFVVALWLVGALTPGYAPALQPVGFLGMAGAPLAGWWNVLGFMLPGLLVTVFAVALLAPLQRCDAGAAARIGAWMLSISGLAFAGNGLFAYDLAQPDGVTSKLHVAMLMIALLAFLPAVLAMSLGLRGRPGWRALVVSGPLFALAALASLLPRMSDLVPGLQGQPGYPQHITLLLYFAWLALAAWTALRSSRRSSRSGRLGQ